MHTVTIKIESLNNESLREAMVLIPCRDAQHAEDVARIIQSMCHQEKTIAESARA